MEAEELLKQLEYLYLALENGYQGPAHKIKYECEISHKIWVKLITGKIIAQNGFVGRNPVYKWVGREPDLTMASTLLKEYSELINKVIWAEDHENGFISNDELIHDSMLLPRINIESGNQLLKPKTMLHEKDRLFNWVVPEGSGGNNIVTEDFRFNVTHNTFYLGRKFLDEHFPAIDRKNVKVAFLLNKGEQPFMAINPPAGIPFFIFKSSSKGSTPSLSNKKFSLRVKKYFNLVGNIIPFKLDPFQRINGMMLFKIVP